MKPGNEDHIPREKGIAAVGKKADIQGYLDYVHAPWGKLFYQLAWHPIECKGKRILDFGSGFGITADHFAQYNRVTAVEPNIEMVKHQLTNHPYEQIIGDMDALKTMPDQSFDVIICHNVMEYLNNREELLLELNRLLKPDGFISIIKHNRAGKIMQKAVFEYRIDEALKLLENGHVESAHFGTIQEYDDYELEDYAKGMLSIQKIYGLRMFYALQRNELKTGDEWLSNMYALECRAEEIPEFRDIAFFHHIILRQV